MTVKRQLEEFDVSSIKQNLNAIVHSVVTGLSPIKKSKRNENFEPVSVVSKGLSSLLSSNNLETYFKPVLIAFEGLPQVLYHGVR